MKRASEIFGFDEIKDLKVGMDFRSPQFRREVFLRFYEFHLKYRLHAGAVYQFLPHLAVHFDWGIEESLWFASINGMTQYPMTSLAIFEQIPVPPFTERQFHHFEDWFNKNWVFLPFDTDRRYQKRDCIWAVWTVNEAVKKYGSLQEFYTGDFKTLWKRVRTELHSLGRLGAWSGLEFIKIASRGVLDFEFDDLMISDRSGSKSHRNGLCKVLGRDDLDWWDKGNPSFDGKYTKEQYAWLEEEGRLLLAEAKERFKGEGFIGDVGYETLETALCCYKGWHRPNRRYPNVYIDMTYGRLLDTAHKNPGLDLGPFWQARANYLPDNLRIECQPNHPQYNAKPLSRIIQNHYRLTGQVVMMDRDWPCFKNDFNDSLA